jgi:hypothetical protein
LFNSQIPILRGVTAIDFVKAPDRDFTIATAAKGWLPPISLMTPQ